MGASASRIWGEICSLQSDDIRAHMIGTVLQSPDLVLAARHAGVYSYVLAWLTAYKNGQDVPFPYAREQQMRWSTYASRPAVAAAPAPEATHAIIVSPAAKALDYFKESLALLGIDESETLTYERLKAGYKRASLKAHPDKGGSKEAFDEVRRAFQYVEKILNRINPRFSAEDTARMKAPVSMESAMNYRASTEPHRREEKPVALSAKKLDMSMFNKLFEENRLPDPTRDAGYGDWLKSQGGGDAPAADPRLKGKFNQETFESVFREHALKHRDSTAITKRLEPEALISPSGTELGGSTSNFTAAFGSDTQFTDLKEAYTTGSTVYHEVADVRVQERSARSIKDAQAQRAAEMARVDPDEKARIAAAAAALEERERHRLLRLAKQDTAAEAWSEQMRRRMFVTNG
jgi:hypothetical protein